MRAAIGRRMLQSKQAAPHFYVTTELDMGPALADLDRRNAGLERGERLSLTAMLVKAVALTIAQHPEFNAVWNGDTLELVDPINIGVAIALDDGLIAPALLDCGHIDTGTIGSRLRDLVERTRAGKLRAPEISEATFTLSNLGMFDVTHVHGDHHATAGRDPGHRQDRGTRRRRGWKGGRGSADDRDDLGRPQCARRCRGRPIPRHAGRHAEIAAGVGRRRR